MHISRLLTPKISPLPLRFSAAPRIPEALFPFHPATPEMPEITPAMVQYVQQAIYTDNPPPGWNYPDNSLKFIRQKYFPVKSTDINTPAKMSRWLQQFPEGSSHLEFPLIAIATAAAYTDTTPQLKQAWLLYCVSVDQGEILTLGAIQEILPRLPKPLRDASVRLLLSQKPENLPLASVLGVNQDLIPDALLQLDVVCNDIGLGARNPSYMPKYTATRLSALSTLLPQARHTILSYLMDRFLSNRVKDTLTNDPGRIITKQNWQDARGQKIDYPPGFEDFERLRETRTPSEYIATMTTLISDEETRNNLLHFIAEEDRIPNKLRRAVLKHLDQPFPPVLGRGWTQVAVNRIREGLARSN